MNRIFTSVSMLLLCGVLTFAAPDRGRASHQQNGSRTEQPKNRPAARPGAAARPSGNSGHSSGTRPGNNTRPGNLGNQNNRPGNVPQGGGNHNGNHNNNRPGNNGHNNRPGNNGHHNDYRPGNNWNYGHGGNHNHGPSRPTPPPPPPGHNYHHHNHPHMPPYYGWYRPTPPAYWQAPPAWRPFSSILGVALGTALNITVNALINNGYTVTSYGNDNVYVNNVPMLNMIWPDAVLFYNNMGGLCGSRFVYSTPYYDQGRYNAAYASLVGGYGAPMSIQNMANGGIEATWWGTGNQFIRLAYQASYAQDGSLRYFTTLSFGN